ncbi:hypothetical protein ElyMa_001482500 [Elysia marginata]|uniref:Uncharacterized protein n=1 Tax=Elysia marginata TaxID=1093978 RepID=A0AAV4J370_9GAST|nr:hypothetical protein ElyMa_001482500 [Elysia marginata]
MQAATPLNRPNITEALSEPKLMQLSQLRPARSNSTSKAANISRPVELPEGVVTLRTSVTTFFHCGTSVGSDTTAPILCRWTHLMEK